MAVGDQNTLGGAPNFFPEKYNLCVFIRKSIKHIFLALAFLCEAFFSSTFLVQNLGAIHGSDSKNNSKAVAD